MSNSLYNLACICTRGYLRSIYGSSGKPNQTQVALIYTLSTSCTGKVKRGVHAVCVCVCKREKVPKAKVCVVRNKRSGHHYEDGRSLNYARKLFLPRLASRANFLQEVCYPERRPLDAKSALFIHASPDSLLHTT